MLEDTWAVFFRVVEPQSKVLLSKKYLRNLGSLPKLSTFVLLTTRMQNLGKKTKLNVLPNFFFWS